MTQPRAQLRYQDPDGGEPLKAPPFAIPISNVKTRLTVRCPYCEATITTDEKWDTICKCNRPIRLLHPACNTCDNYDMEWTKSGSNWTGSCPHCRPTDEEIERHRKAMATYYKTTPNF